MKGWMSYLLWEGLPFLLPLLAFGFIGIINWDYERKLIWPDDAAAGWTDSHLGLLLLAVAAVQALAGSLILFLVRVFWSSPFADWFSVLVLVLVTIFLIFPSLFIVILGPASITMKEQMSAEAK